MIDDDEDKEKFVIVYNQYRRLMLKVAEDILHSRQDAEDAVQEAFFKIAENISEISDPKCNKTKNFVVIIVERKSLDILKKKKVTEYGYINDLSADEAADPSSEMYYEHIIDSESSLIRTLLKLPAAYREVLLLRFYYGYSLKEIADLLGITTNYAGVLNQRARDKLRKFCEEEGYDI